MPRARVFARFLLDRYPTDWSAGFYGCARLASGTTVRSKIGQYDQDIVDYIAEWNAKAHP